MNSEIVITFLLLKVFAAIFLVIAQFKITTGGALKKATMVSAMADYLGIFTIVYYWWHGTSYEEYSIVYILYSYAVPETSEIFLKKYSRSWNYWITQISKVVMPIICVISVWIWKTFLPI